ncbi:MAG: hypothetical protein IH851_10535 [Armatimonadetes bacterium]|nr:hypothetical protein [Armatimonadota bacterium]
MAIESGAKERTFRYRGRVIVLVDLIAVSLAIGWLASPLFYAPVPGSLTTYLIGAPLAICIAVYALLVFRNARLVVKGDSLYSYNAFNRRKGPVRLGSATRLALMESTDESGLVTHARRWSFRLSEGPNRTYINAGLVGRDALMISLFEHGVQAVDFDWDEVLPGEYLGRPRKRRRSPLWVRLMVIIPLLAVIAFFLWVWFFWD